VASPQASHAVREPNERMRVALFVPCYVDQLRPTVGLATLALLEAVGCEVAYPEEQTCCGQPFATAGEPRRAAALGRRFVEVFEAFDAIVAPSGSCVATLRHGLPRWSPDPRAHAVAARTRELCELLGDPATRPLPRGRYPHRVGIHASCHALRELRLGSPSESREPPRPDPARRLLSGLEGLELVEPARRDECCGFGGVFAIEQEAVSARMGLDRLTDHQRAGAEVIVSTDVSCLLQLEGVARRHGHPQRFLHVAEVLAAACGLDGDAGRAS